MILIMIGISQDLDMKHRGGEDNHLATAMDPYSKVDYSRITPEAGMVTKKAFGDDSPLRLGAGKSFWTLPISGRRWWQLAVCFMEKCSSL
jgi:hypothetical protein